MMEEGLERAEAVRKGAMDRLRPVGHGRTHGAGRTDQWSELPGLY